MPDTYNPDFTYWNHTGKHQGAYEALHVALVPAQGDAETMTGELLRCLGCVYYDVYNNGGGNLLESRLSEMQYLIPLFPQAAFLDQIYDRYSTMMGIRDSHVAAWTMGECDDDPEPDEYGFNVWEALKPHLGDLELLADAVIERAIAEVKALHMVDISRLP